jgi:microcystin-dependent protein
MTEVYVGQIMMTGFGFAQRGFAMCNGQTLAINQNQALFALLGTTYGGNGVSTFQLPNLMGRTPMGFGTSVDGSWQPGAVPLGEIGGVENVTLTQAQLPAHNHTPGAQTAAGVQGRAPGTLFAKGTTGATDVNLYGPPNSLVAMNPISLSPAGGNLPHPNMQPFQVINFNIALQGVFPSRN